MLPGPMHSRPNLSGFRNKLSEEPRFWAGGLGKFGYTSSPTGVGFTPPHSPRPRATPR
ncbi:hypothetical protein SBA1_550100 [Candidatus Sulfotelmatobacter kueseliae]|uniref:Uncharacterized protein n=1 Tax=Candidatus Sulfotelmatobacter kueseliae TaxID=2042962 RepID=A0A2U3KYJ8_9BACT|nr:hypothetical protein SBA1_550100 [Candidatus Sulfotelmatobacter kueseliae]